MDRIYYVYHQYVYLVQFRICPLTLPISGDDTLLVHGREAIVTDFFQFPWAKHHILRSKRQSLAIPGMFINAFALAGRRSYGSVIHPRKHQHSSAPRLSLPTLTYIGFRSKPLHQEKLVKQKINPNSGPSWFIGCVHTLFSNWNASLNPEADAAAAACSYNQFRAFGLHQQNLSGTPTSSHPLHPQAMSLLSFWCFLLTSWGPFGALLVVHKQHSRIFFGLDSRLRTSSLVFCRQLAIEPGGRLKSNTKIGFPHRNRIYWKIWNLIRYRPETNPFIHLPLRTPDPWRSRRNLCSNWDHERLEMTDINKWLLYHSERQPFSLVRAPVHEVWLHHGPQELFRVERHRVGDQTQLSSFGLCGASGEILWYLGVFWSGQKKHEKHVKNIWKHKKTGVCVLCFDGFYSFVGSKLLSTYPSFASGDQCSNLRILRQHSLSSLLSLFIVPYGSFDASASSSEWKLGPELLVGWSWWWCTCKAYRISCRAQIQRPCPPVHCSC